MNALVIDLRWHSYLESLLFGCCFGMLRFWTYNGNEMDEVWAVMDREWRASLWKETFGAFVCCGNLNERTWLTDARPQSLWWQASEQNPATNISCWVEQRSKNLESLEDGQYGLAAGICRVHQQQKGSWKRRCCIKDIGSLQTETVIFFLLFFCFGVWEFHIIEFSGAKGNCFQSTPKISEE